MGSCLQHGSTDTLQCCLGLIQLRQFGNDVYDGSDKYGGAIVRQDTIDHDLIESVDDECSQHSIRYDYHDDDEC